MRVSRKEAKFRKGAILCRGCVCSQAFVPGAPTTCAVRNYTKNIFCILHFSFLTSKRGLHRSLSLLRNACVDPALLRRC